MMTIIHPNDLEQQQEFLLEMFLYHSFMAESDETDGINMNEKLAAEEAGFEFDNLYHYDSDTGNGIQNIHNALNFDWDES